MNEHSEALKKPFAKQVLNSMHWSYASTIVLGALQLVVISVLAHILTPHDFGLVGIALIFISFSDRFGELGVSHALIQRESLSELHKRTAVTLSLTLGILVWITLWSCSPYIALFFREPLVEPILRVISCMILIESAAVVPRSLLQRDLKLKALMLAENLAYLFGNGATAIILAFNGYGPWSLVWGHVAGRLIRTSIVCRLIFPRGTFALKRHETAELLRDGIGYSLVRLLNFLALQGDNFVVARTLGASSLGLYGRAYQLMTLVGKYFADALDKALFPAMARRQSEKNKVLKTFQLNIELVGIASILASLGLFMFAEEVVLFLFGSQWTSVIPVVSILALGVFFRTAYKCCDTAIRAMGLPYRHAVRQGLYTIFIVTGAWIGSHWGLSGVAVGVLVAIFLNYVSLTMLLMQVLKVSPVQILKLHIPLVWFFALQALTLFFAAQLLRSMELPSFAILAAGGFTQMLITPFILLACPKPWRFTLIGFLEKLFEESKRKDSLPLVGRLLKLLA